MALRLRCLSHWSGGLRVCVEVAISGISHSGMSRKERNLYLHGMLLSPNCYCLGPSTIRALAAIPGNHAVISADQVMAYPVDARWASFSASFAFLDGCEVLPESPYDWSGNERLQKRRSGARSLWSQVGFTLR